MPRMYNKKVGVRAIDNRLRKRVEERDAIVWSIDTTSKVVNLKIQGSDTLYVAQYHQVLTAVPYYCKVGAAVRIRHRRGNKGYVEVVGTGRAIPTPVEGSGLLPDMNLADMVLTGMQVSATDPTTMFVQVSSGTYRLDNVIYTWSKTNNWYYTMNDPAPLIMGTDDVTMGGQYYVVEIPAAPGTTSWGRYDILVVGPHDGEIDVVSGTAVNLSTTAPTKPSTPDNHVLVDWIFVRYSDTEVTDSMIGQSYSDPAPNTHTVVLSGAYVVDQEIIWNESGNAYATITITVYDQYEGNYTFSGARGRLTLASGYGQLWGGYTGTRSDYAESPHYTTATFIYYRDQTETEINPVLTYEVEGFSTVFVITLLDILGDPV